MRREFETKNGENKRMKLLASAALALLIGVNAQSASIAEAARETPSATAGDAESWRKTPPRGKDPRPFSLPEVQKYKLKNGLTVDMVEDHRFPFVTMTMGLKVGTVLDPKDMSGVASLTAGMLTQGTDTKTSKQIADEVDFIGGGLGATTDADFTIVSGSSLSNYSDRLFNSFTDVLLNPRFPQSEFDLKKTNLVQELKMKRSNPDFLLEERFHKVLFGEHPYSVISPTQESVEKITRADLEKFHQANYVPNEATLIIVGDFDSTRMKALVEKNFEAWKAGTVEGGKTSELPTRNAQRVYLVDRPGSVQSNIKLGNLAISRTDPDYFPLIVANQILGGAANSRLFLNLREKKSFTYGAYSGVMARKQRGWFGAEAAVRKEVTGPSIKEFFVELKRLRNEEVSAKELNDAKKFLAGSFQLGLETQGGLAQRLLESRLYGLPSDFLETYADKIMAVDVKDVQRVAQKHIDVDNIAITVVGDAKTIRPELEKFAPVDTYDVSGKLSSEKKQVKATGS